MNNLFFIEDVTGELKEVLEKVKALAYLSDSELSKIDNTIEYRESLGDIQNTTYLTLKESKRTQLIILAVVNDIERHLNSVLKETLEQRKSPIQSDQTTG